MFLNIIINRSFCDISQYPIFPWILYQSNYIEKKNNTNNIENKYNIENNNNNNDNNILNTNLNEIEENENNNIKINQRFIKTNWTIIKRTKLFINNFKNTIERKKVLLQKEGKKLT